MVKVDFDNLGIPSIDLETNDNIYRTIIIKTPSKVNLFIYNILGNDASNGEYLIPFTPLNTNDYKVLVYDQDKEVEYSSVSHLAIDKFPIDKATNGFILREKIDRGYDYDRMGSKDDHIYFKSDNDLSDREQKYCSCILKVGAKGTAYNKYAVCAKSVGTTSHRCRANYDIDKLSEPYKSEAMKH